MRPKHPWIPCGLLAVALAVRAAVGQEINLPVIDGPIKVETGQPAAFTLQGVPAEFLDLCEWQVFNRPNDATVLDLADRAGNPVLVFWSRTPGTYAIIADVNMPPVDFHLLTLQFTVGQPEPPPPPPLPPPPPPSDLSAFVENLVDELGIDSDTSQVAGFFQAAVPKIDDGSLRGSRAIVEAVSKPLAGMGTKWKAFSSLLFTHLLHDVRLVTQSQWSDGYKEVALGLGGVK